MPFISHASLNALQEHLDEQRGRAARAEARVRELTDLIVTLKRQGYQPPEPVLPPPTLEAPTPIDLAIRRNIPLRLRSTVYAELDGWRRSGMKDEEIVKRIELGEEAYRG